MENDFTTSEGNDFIPSFEGTFEIHIIVKPEEQAKLFAFCKDKSFHTEKMFNVHPTCAQAFYGKCANQIMVTYWFNGTVDLVVDSAKQVAKKMENFGLTILRVKVEAMAHNKNIMKCSGSHYFECHFKIEIQDLKQWETLADICLKFGSHLFFNPYSHKGYFVPVITLRRYDCNKDTAQNACDDLIKVIEQAGFKKPEKVQSEYAVLDSNVWLDEDWMFKNDPKNIIMAY